MEVDPRSSTAFLNKRLLVVHHEFWLLPVLLGARCRAAIRLPFRRPRAPTALPIRSSAAIRFPATVSNCSFNAAESSVTNPARSHTRLSSTSKLFRVVRSEWFASIAAITSTVRAWRELMVEAKA